MTLDGMRLRKVCADCPFRSDVRFRGLTRERLQDIAESLEQGIPFHCHKTIDYGREDGGHRRQLCAGALSTMERQGTPHSLVQIMTRLGLDVSSHLDADAQPVYDSLEEWVEKVAEDD